MHVLELKRLGILTFFSLLLVSPVYSQNRQNSMLMIDVASCVTMESAIQRFACYEKLAETALQGTSDNFQAPAPAVAERAPQPAAPVVTRAPRQVAPAPTQATPATADAFGFPEENSQEQTEELLSTISEFRETIPNQYIYTLANGQVWRQARPESRLRPRVGQNVRIYPTRWGNDYRMTIEELNTFVQVERVQ